MSFNKFFLISITGFALGGIIWGWVTYIMRFSSPFNYGGAAGISLGFLSIGFCLRGWKNILFSWVSGVVGSYLGFLLAIVLTYPIGLYGIFLFIVIDFVGRLNKQVIDNLFNIFNTGGPDIMIGSWWLGFFMIGFIVSAMYAIAMKRNIWSLSWRGGLGLAVGSLLGPFFGNQFSSPLIIFVISFTVMNISLGISLSKYTYYSVLH